MKKSDNYVTVGVNLNENYLPLLDIIDQIAIERKTSRSSVFRDIVCDYVGFEPENKARPYSSMKHLMVEC